jgi:hypothetical protein
MAAVTGGGRPIAQVVDVTAVDALDRLVAVCEP